MGFQYILTLLILTLSEYLSTQTGFLIIFYSIVLILLRGINKMRGMNIFFIKKFNFNFLFIYYNHLIDECA